MTLLSMRREEEERIISYYGRGESRIFTCTINRPVKMYIASEQVKA